MREKIIGAAVEAHSSLWPGLFESTDQACLAYKLRRQKVLVETEKGLPEFY
jgi:GxxExxY protein